MKMEDIKPTKAKEKNLTGIDFFLLWAGAAVSLAEIWAGGTISGAGFLAAAVAIVIGHVIGNTPLALGGILGSRHGIPTMVSIRPSFGVVGSQFAALLNIIQLVGWTAVMLLICGFTINTLFEDVNYRIWIATAGIITTLWAIVGHRFWKWMQRAAVTLLLVLCVVLTYVVLVNYDISEIIRTGPSLQSPIGFGLAMDLVIAMPISWLPLVSDYSRFSKSSKGAFWGTWWGYLIVGSWMYLLGLFASIATGTDTPDAMVIELMGKAGLIIPAVIIVIFSTVTTTFLDIYSASVSTQNIFSRLSGRWGILGAGILGTIIALFFPATQYETFLLFIGSIFCPLFGVVLSDYFILSKLKIETKELFKKGGKYWYSGGFNITALFSWGVGFLIYHGMAIFLPNIGASLPAIVASALIYYIVMKAKKR
jgi:putative hydroxymethylpyrimidine transporter CytX